MVQRLSTFASFEDATLGMVEVERGLAESLEQSSSLQTLDQVDMAAALWRAMLENRKTILVLLSLLPPLPHVNQLIRPASRELELQGELEGVNLIAIARSLKDVDQVL